MKNILVIGGAGYIGSHMVVMLKDHKYQPIVFDNLSTGYRDFVPKGVPFIQGDLNQEKDIQKVFNRHSIHAVMYFAASSIVPESMKNPLKYYDNNVGACIQLLKVMQQYKVKRLIFSSTAAVYGEPRKVPIPEEASLNPSNPYGRSKLMIEQIIEDTAQIDKDFVYMILRYFNVAGAHESGKIGEAHNPETHLIPLILQSLKAPKKSITLYGDDYPTKDGFCVRDYVHIDDLCWAHLLAMQAFGKNIKNEILNLGSQDGFSVKEVVDTVESVTGKAVKYKIGARRSGDPAKLIACSQKAKELLGWLPVNDLRDIIQSAWVWSKR